MKKLYIVGIGPGGKDYMTFRAVDVIRESDTIVGYTPYLAYISEFTEGKEIITNSMGGELERVKAALNAADSGKTVSIISTGDAGLYGMAGPVYEMAVDHPEVEIEVVPGVTSAFASAAHLGSPLMQDTALISLSDIMNDWNGILDRVRAAAETDFCMALYNPKSRTRTHQIEEAVDIIRRYRRPDTPVGIVRNAGRDGLEMTISTLSDVPFDIIDMMSTVIIGNSQTTVREGRMITPRGYAL